MKKCIVVTTINKPTRAIKKIIERDDYDVIIVGDKKTPSDYHGLNCIFLDVTKQRSLFPEFDAVLPFNHYARKNMGYLYAAINGYHVIAESDDDNIPYKGWGNIELFQTI